LALAIGAVTIAMFQINVIKKLAAKNKRISLFAFFL
jgi:hypothetical protein